MSATKIAMTASQSRNTVRYIKPPPLPWVSLQTMVNDQSFFVILPWRFGGF